jgi:hypothetical protein
VLIAAGGLTVAQPQQPAVAEQCDPAAVMNTRLDELGRSGYVWTIEPLEGPGPGAVTDIDAHEVLISPGTPCVWVGDVVAHEWMHVQQGHKYGSNAQVYAAYSAFEVEMVADCGAMLLGAAVMPYIDQHRSLTGDGCSPYELVAAQALIDKARNPL